MDGVFSCVQLFCVNLVSGKDTFHEQLTEDRDFLRAERRLDTELVDKLILQLNRIYPQILTDKEATRVGVTGRMHAGTARKALGEQLVSTASGISTS